RRHARARRPRGRGAPRHGRGHRRPRPGGGRRPRERADEGAQPRRPLGARRAGRRRLPGGGAAGRHRAGQGLARRADGAAGGAHRGAVRRRGAPPAVTALVLAAALGLLLTGSFVQLARRFGWGKAIRSAGPESHQAKAGTPTMGGAAFLLAATVAWLLLGDDLGADLAPALLVLGSGLLGLWDDALALQRKRAIAQGLEVGTGLLARYRLLGQGALALGFAVWAVGAGHALFGVAWLDVLAYAFVVVGSINALNFTDGLDGLAAGVAAIALLFFLGSPFAAALLGALLGFLWYNAHPARVIMGGVGAEALGAGLAALAITQGTVWYL